MTDESNVIPYPTDGPAAAAEVQDVELLIGRIIDGEATDVDRTRFEAAAAREPRLWRELALRQQDMTRLSAAVETEVAGGADVELPTPATRHISSLQRAVAFAGWAAVIVLGIGWALYAGSRTPPATPPAGIPVGADHVTLTADEHFNQYLAAEHVLGEMAPVVLQVEETSDGRVVLRYIRRIEELQLYDSLNDVPVDEQGVLTVRPGRD